MEIAASRRDLAIPFAEINGVQTVLEISGISLDQVSVGRQKSIAKARRNSGGRSGGWGQEAPLVRWMPRPK